MLVGIDDSSLRSFIVKFTLALRVVDKWHIPKFAKFMIAHIGLDAEDFALKLREHFSLRRMK